jgi:hypothetical protein
MGTKEGDNFYSDNRHIYSEEKFGEWVIPTQSNPTQGSLIESTIRPTQANNMRLHSETITKPTYSSFWKPMEPSLANTSISRTTIEQPLRTSLEGQMQLSRHENVIQSEEMNKKLYNKLPITNIESFKTTNYKKTNLDESNLGSGKINQDHLTLHDIRSSMSEPFDRTMTENFKNIPVKEGLKIPIDSHKTTNIRSNLESFSNSIVRTTRDIKRPEAQNGRTNIRFLDKTGELGMKNDNPRRSLLIENHQTVHDRTSLGTQLYETVQSRDGTSHVLSTATSGAFQSLGNAIPRFDRVYNNGSELPVTTDFIDVKKQAANEYMNRFQNQMNE